MHCLRTSWSRTRWSIVTTNTITSNHYTRMSYHTAHRLAVIRIRTFVMAFVAVLIDLFVVVVITVIAMKWHLVDYLLCVAAVLHLLVRSHQPTLPELL